MLAKNRLITTLVMLTTLISLSANAAITYELNAFSRGCFNGQSEVCSGSGTPNGIFYTGEGSSVFEGEIRRSYFAFDLSGLVGNVISGEIFIEIDSTFGYRGDDLFESVAFYSISDSSMDQLINGTFFEGSGFYSDLGTGINLGGPTVTPADANSGSITHVMGPQWISALNADIGGNFGFGGRLFTTTLNGDQEGLFAGSGSEAFTLRITTDGVRSVPLPTGLSFLMGAFLVINLLSISRRKKHLFCIKQ
ncbi:hypothetical protein [Glaciecola petra]|uniref:PEP-CTERM sorting domain-containing protein n=1 Tax=Glaciecola petra TaxID=3075602 RepID=A0ABU2ZQS3_9ALTE|nr:hypothetical protein [Aestuariibacter sp. P117]MDT0594988.1 hypothetical protein [Aestuariibacter sp. P117]